MVLSDAGVKIRVVKIDDGHVPIDELITPRSSGELCADDGACSAGGPLTDTAVTCSGEPSALPTVGQTLGPLRGVIARRDGQRLADLWDGWERERQRRIGASR